MTRIYDYHLHSTYSFDAVSTMEEVVKSGIEKGICELAFTDHIEFHDNTLSELSESLKREYAEFLALKEKYGHKISLKFGMEAGQLLYKPHETDILCGLLPYDFIIFSLHCIRYGVDYHDMDYTGLDISEEAGKYLNELKELVDTFSDFSVLGHCDYLARYVKIKNLDFDFDSLKYEFEPIFKALIKKGKGIELNTSGFRTSHGAAMPSKEILGVYRECGGEIITIGSDAHNKNDIGANFHKGVALLKEAGFNKITIFNKKTPEFVNI